MLLSGDYSLGVRWIEVAHRKLGTMEITSLLRLVAYQTHLVAMSLQWLAI